MTIYLSKRSINDFVSGSPYYEVDEDSGQAYYFEIAREGDRELFITYYDREDHIFICSRNAEIDVDDEGLVAYIDISEVKKYFSNKIRDQSAEDDDAARSDDCRTLPNSLVGTPRPGSPVFWADDSQPRTPTGQANAEYDTNQEGYRIA